VHVNKTFSKAVLLAQRKLSYQVLDWWIPIINTGHWLM